MMELAKSPEMKILEERVIKSHALTKGEFPDSEVTKVRGNDFLVYPNKKEMTYPLWIQPVVNRIMAHNIQEHKDFAQKLVKKYKENGEPEFEVRYG